MASSFPTTTTSSTQEGILISRPKLGPPTPLELLIPLYFFFQRHIYPITGRTPNKFIYSKKKLRHLGWRLCEIDGIIYWFRIFRSVHHVYTEVDLRIHWKAVNYALRKRWIPEKKFTFVASVGDDFQFSYCDALGNREVTMRDDIDPTTRDDINLTMRDDIDPSDLPFGGRWISFGRYSFQPDLRLLTKVDVSEQSTRMRIRDYIQVSGYRANDQYDALLTPRCWGFAMSWVDISTGCVSADLPEDSDLSLQDSWSSKTRRLNREYTLHRPLVGLEQDHSPSALDDTILCITFGLPAIYKARAAQLCMEDGEIPRREYFRGYVDESRSLAGLTTFFLGTTTMLAIYSSHCLPAVTLMQASQGCFISAVIHSIALAYIFLTISYIEQGRRWFMEAVEPRSAALWPWLFQASAAIWLLWGLTIHVIAIIVLVWHDGGAGSSQPVVLYGESIIPHVVLTGVLGCGMVSLLVVVRSMKKYLVSDAAA